jgi:hypothetical protein
VQKTKASKKQKEQGHNLRSSCRPLVDHYKNLAPSTIIAYLDSELLCAKYCHLIGRSRVKVSFTVMIEGLRIIDDGAIKNRFAPGTAGEETPTPKVTKECEVYRRSGQMLIMRRNTSCCGRMPSPQDIRALFETQISTCYFISIDLNLN